MILKEFVNLEKVREDDELTEDNAVEGRSFVTKSHCLLLILLKEESYNERNI